MRKILPHLWLWAALGLAGSTAMAQEVGLRFEPDLTTPSFATAKADDPLLRQAQAPTELGLLEKGWRVVMRPGEYTGWVERSDLNKDLTVKPGAVIHLRPDKISPAMSTMAQGDAVEALAVSDWVQVKLAKPVPVWFVLPEYAPVAEVAGRPAPLPVLPPPPAPAVAAVPAPAAAPDPTPAVVPAAVPAPVETRAAPSTPAGARTRPTPMGAEASGGPIAEYFDGFLRAVPSSLLGPGRRYTLQLVDAQGRRLAFLDTTNVLVNGPLSSFLERHVQVYGQRGVLDGGRELVLTARIIRLRDTRAVAAPAAP